MTLSRSTLCALYGLLAVLAFVGSWGNILGLVGQEGFVGGTIRFWQDTLANPSSRFITVDLLFLGLAVIVWMVLEARRLGIPGVWLYVVAGLLVAISLTVPLFMLQRERKLAVLEPGTPAGRMTTGDAAGIAALGMIGVAYAVASLLR